MNNRKIIVELIILLAVLVGCSDSNSVESNLYFGMSTKNGEVTSKQWEDFRDNTLQQVFDGFTEIDCNGYWKSGSGTKYVEKSKLIIYTHEPSLHEQSKIDSVKNIYKQRFEQESVLQVDKAVKAEY